MTAATEAQTSSVATRWLFTLTIFVGSFLLFLIQPLFARLILPRLGGAPSVWNSAMLFYQAMLLAGYFYAHKLAPLPLRRQLVIHLAVFGLAALTLPIGIAPFYPAVGTTELTPSLWLIGLMATSIGPVFFAVSAQAPLMQAWFSRSGDPGAHNPYFLYAASNGGSLLALLAYPLLVEPTLPLGDQTLLWSAGFIVLAMLIALCGLALRNGVDTAATVAPAEPTAWRQRLHWAALAAVPSGLLLSTTTHLTTDIMAMPLLWVVPLALYLVTFIIAFAETEGVLRRNALFAAPLLLLMLGSYIFMANGTLALLMALAGLVLFFFVALALHGELARLRPPASQLTDFYLWVSIGGMLGGLFCALVAPMIFNWSFEHPLLLIAAALLIPARPVVPFISRLWQRPRVAFVLRFILPVLSLVASFFVGERMFSGNYVPAMAVGHALIATAAVLAIGRRLHFAFHYAMLMLALGGWSTIDVSMIEGARERSFFGIYTISGSASRQVRELMHGTTLHGVQSILPELKTHPMSYYAPDSGVGQVFDTAPALFDHDARMGFVGLGTGTLACYARPGQRWTAYEIDPAIVAIATDKRLFSYISDCKPDLRIVLGDARLTLSKERPGQLDMLAVDAFSSDAIPLHLMTKEAFDVYARALAPDGILLVHISNRHIDLEPVVAAIAKSRGWSAMLRDYDPEYEPSGGSYTKSHWIALTRDERRMREVIAVAQGQKGDWRPLRTRSGLEPWSDDFASVLPVLKI